MLKLFAPLLVLLCGASTAYSISFNRDGGGTKIIFENSDLEATRASAKFENGWLARDLEFRPGCYLNTPPFILPYLASIDLTIHYMAHWRDVIDTVADLSDISLARFDFAYQDANTEPHRKSQFLDVADVGNLNWHSIGDDFIQARAESLGVKTIHLKNVQVPAASQNIKIKMCAIAPKATLRIERIDLTITDPKQFLPAAEQINNSPLRCFDTGLFLTNCHLEETVLDEPGNLEMEYEVGVTFGCVGHEVDFALVTDRNAIVLTPSMGTVKIRGRGLKLVDRSPAKTQTATFNPGCTLSVVRVDKEVSRGQVDALREQRATLEADLENAKLSSRAFVDITLLGRMIEAIRASLELTNKLNRGSRSSVLNDVTLQELLSPLQMKSLTELLETRNIVEASDMHYDRFKKLEHEALKKLRELSCSTGPSGKNGVCNEGSI